MDAGTPMFPTPHLAKLNALLANRRLPRSDRPRVEEAIRRYEHWIGELRAVHPGQEDAVQRLVDATNRYKMYVELDLIFDSPGDFLYRQKGQLKLDNTILEEFLPQLLYRALSLPDNSFEFGPQNTFAGCNCSATAGSDWQTQDILHVVVPCGCHSRANLPDHYM